MTSSESLSSSHDVDDDDHGEEDDDQVDEKVEEYDDQGDEKVGGAAEASGWKSREFFCSEQFTGFPSH